MSHRQERIRHAIQREISQLLEYETRDPRLQNVTITQVSVTGDLRVATIYYATRGVTKPDEAQDGLDSATGYLRRALAKRLDLRFAPEIRFAPDEQIAQGERFLNLLDRIQEEKKTSKT